MHDTQLKNFIIGLGEHSVGASVTGSTRHLIPLHSEDDETTGSLPLSHALRWTYADADAHGSARISNMTLLSCTDTARLPEPVLQKLVCLYVIGQLDVSATKEAMEFLTDTYSWQKKSENLVIPEEQITTHGDVQHKGHVAREDFVIE